jgi:hypothetical protein
MGANVYLNSSRANSMAVAYKICVEVANEEYGHQEGYSGQINMSSGFVDKTAHYEAWCKTQKPGKRSPDWYASAMDAENKLEKSGPAWGICLEKPVSNNNKIKSTVVHNVFKGTRKWELVYIPQTRSESWFGKTHNNKADAVKEAREYTERTGNRTIVVIEKILSKTSGNRIVADIEYKSSKNEKPGRYFFCGLASD